MKRAIVVHGGNREESHNNIVRILEFFGVPWTAMAASELSHLSESLENVALVGPIEAVRRALKCSAAFVDASGRPVTVFAFANADQTESEEALRSICSDATISLAECATGEHRISISPDLRDVTGPMSGVEFAAPIEERTCVITTVNPACTTIAAVDGTPVFIRIASGDANIFFSACPSITNIDDPVTGSFFDVKRHFLAAVPFVMFVKHTFREVVWREQELGACLIVDDPLLKFRYGRCDFRALKSSMEKHGFTTNISFIPWNWRRTSQSAARFFREDRRFSVSIHGCDHTKGEFGDSSVARLESKASLAMARMKLHEARTGIHHDRVMVFPQGVFSSVCPEVLKRSGYIAAVNTETVPVDVQGASTQIRDVWDVAITRYGDFPIFTRRYAHHGIENFAFDLLLGKPCLIVSHHESFGDNANELVELIHRLNSLNCKLHWKSLEEVVREARRVRRSGNGTLENHLYGPELQFGNSRDTADMLIENKETSRHLVAVLSNDAPVPYARKEGSVVVRKRPEADEELSLDLTHSKLVVAQTLEKRSLAVAARRLLSELRDKYEWPKSTGTPNGVQPASRLQIGLLILFVTFSLLRIVSTYSVFNQTWDEPVHIASGVEWLQRGTYTYEVLHPPLGRIAVGLGPYLAGARLAEADLHPTILVAGGNAILEYKGKYFRNLSLARAGVLPFFGLSVWIIWIWTKRIFSNWTAVAAVGLFTVLPPVLGHAALATTDIPLTGMMLLAAFSFDRWMHQATLLRTLAVGFTFGLAVVSKFTALLFLPATCTAIALSWFLAANGRLVQRARILIARLRNGFFPAVAVFCIVVLAAYHFSIHPIATASQRPHLFVDKILGAHGKWHDLGYRVVETMPVPAPEVFEGIAQARGRVSLPSPMYLLGKVQTHGWWYFFPVALAVKTPIPWLILAAIGVVAAIEREDRRSNWQPAVPVAIAIALLAVCLPTNFNIGLRHILPIYPFLSIVGGSGLVWLLGAIEFSPLKLMGASALVIWLLVSSIKAQPDNLAYFNEVAERHPERFLVDSDLDWGQDLKRLGDELRRRNVEQISIDYNGSADLKKAGLPDFRIMKPCIPATGWIAVSVLRLKMSNRTAGCRGYAWLDPYTPVTVVGKSIWLYWIPGAVRAPVNQASDGSSSNNKMFPVARTGRPE